MAVGMTYGTMPSFEDWDEQFDKECLTGFSIMLGSYDSRACDDTKLCDGIWHSRELYDACKDIVDRWLSERCTEESPLEDAMSVVSSILSTLGFEWI